MAVPHRYVNAVAFGNTGREVEQMKPKNEEDVWTSIDNLIDLLEDVMIKGRDIVDPKEIEEYTKAEMATAYRHLRRE